MADLSSFLEDFFGLFSAPNPAFVPTTDLDDILIGLQGDQAFSGRAGDDQLFGLGGRDTLDGGPGDDLLDGGSGNDFLSGGVVPPTPSFPFPGLDPGNDDLRGGSGDDNLQGGAGDDQLEGGAGVDTLQGQDGDDRLFGGGGNDLTILKSEGFFTGGLFGGNGDDFLGGGAGDDTLNGGPGNDLLDGGSGNDTLNGGSSGFPFFDHDELWGGSGSDTFQYSINGEATVEDFQPGIEGFQPGDRIQLQSSVQTELGSVAATGGDPKLIDAGDRGVAALSDGGDRLGGELAIDFHDALV